MEIFFGFIACNIIFFIIFADVIELTKKKTWKEKDVGGIFQNGKLFENFLSKSFPKPKPKWR